MIYRLSGDPKPSNIWKIINAGNSRKDFIQSYSIKSLNNKSYLQVYFDKNLLVQKFNELSIPALGTSRPVILFLINVDTGSSKPYFLKDSESKSELDLLIKNLLKKLSSNRGIFLELPEPDLNELDLLTSYSKLINSNKLLNSKYASNKTVEIKLTKIGINNWLVDGDINFKYENNDFNNFFIKNLEKHILIEVDKLFSKNLIDTSQETLAQISISNISNYEDYKISKEVIGNLVATKDIDISSFKINNISYQVNIYGNFDSFVNEISDSNFIKVNKVKYSENTIYMDFMR
ncbi:MAG: hypothetical protein CMQ83_04695 [Gammaproteobacteria bacterium]|nr:hypothetical protein [Gammaproteobacteria bacterium]